jgi:hypothetical protein
MLLYTYLKTLIFQLRQGIARLQAAYRAQRLALQFNLLRERLVVLQGHCKGYVTRVKLRQRRKAVVTIQSGWRRVLAKKKVEMLRREVCQSLILRLVSTVAIYILYIRARIHYIVFTTTRLECIHVLPSLFGVEIHVSLTLICSEDDDWKLKGSLLKRKCV